jgi:hypothetical protein
MGVLSYGLTGNVLLCLTPSGTAILQSVKLQARRPLVRMPARARCHVLVGAIQTEAKALPTLQFLSSR